MWISLSFGQIATPYNNKIENRFSVYLFRPYSKHDKKYKELISLPHSLLLKPQTKRDYRDARLNCDMLKPPTQ